MTKRELVINMLEFMGYKPKVDNDGDVMFRFQLKTLYVLGTQEEESNYLLVMLPQLYEMDDGEEIKTLTVCNKLTRDIKLAKVYVDSTFKNVSASCEFYYCNSDDCLQSQFEYSLNILSQIRSAFFAEIRDIE